MKRRPRPTTAPALSTPGRGGRSQVDERWQAVFRQNGHTADRGELENSVVRNGAPRRLRTKFSSGDFLITQPPRTRASLSKPCGIAAEFKMGHPTSFDKPTRSDSSSVAETHPKLWRTASSPLRPATAGLHSRFKATGPSQRMGATSRSSSMCAMDLSQQPYHESQHGQTKESSKVKPLPFKVSSDGHLAKYCQQRNLQRQKKEKQRPRKNGSLQTVTIIDHDSPESFADGLWSVWQYHGQDGWNDFDFHACDKLEEAYVMGESLYFLRVETGWCECDFRMMRMIQGGEASELRRIRVPSHEPTAHSMAAFHDPQAQGCPGRASLCIMKIYTEGSSARTVHSLGDRSFSDNITTFLTS